MKSCFLLAALTFLLSSCLKQSIADAMLNNTGKQGGSASMRYEINGNVVNISVKNADNQGPGYKILECTKAGGYILSGVLGTSGDFVYTFNTDSLKVGNYQYTGGFGSVYVTTFEGKAQYVYAATDRMSFTVTSYKNGHISGTFTGQLTPAIIPRYPDNVYGASSSVVIKNGSFNNIPVTY